MVFDQITGQVISLEEFTRRIVARFAENTRGPKPVGVERENNPLETGACEERGEKRKLGEAAVEKHAKKARL